MILQNPNEILRKNSEKVPISEISGVKIQNIIKKMKRALIQSKDLGGVALAAPQIGFNLRIFIILEWLIRVSKGEEIADGDVSNPIFLVFINPQILKKSNKKQVVKEGCLSVNGMTGKIKRPEKITVKAFDESGQEFKMFATGIMAQAVEHEMDHLDGALFIDKATDLKKEL